MDDGNTNLDRKLVILGCTDVGKTSITMRYCHNSFTTPTSATIGASFLQKRILVDQIKMTLQVWDTAGQERFRSMAPMYYRNAKAAILVFDLTKEDTFDKLKGWLHDLQQHVENDIVLALVGNKCDTNYTFDKTKAELFAQEIGASYHQTSAKTGTGIEELFIKVSKQLLIKYNESIDKDKKLMGNSLDDKTANSFPLHKKQQHHENESKKCC